MTNFLTTFGWGIVVMFFLFWGYIVGLLIIRSARDRIINKKSVDRWIYRQPTEEDEETDE